jgi:hypothetical protein
MDHSEAIQRRATERYLLGELTPDQREQFEEHFFSCPECADDVRRGAILIDNARQVLDQETIADENRVVPWRLRRRGFLGFRPTWTLAAALILLAGAFTYQNLVTIPKLKNAETRPQALTSFSLITAGSRGGVSTVLQVPQNAAFGLYVDIPTTGTFPYYTVAIETESGDRPVHLKVSAEQAKDTVQILVPAGVLKGGKETLVIEGCTAPNSATTEIARYPFVIKFQ